MHVLVASGGSLLAHSRGFIFSAYVGPGHGAITLRGEIDAGAADRLGAHLEGFLGAAVRMISIDATATTSYTPRVLDLLGHAQRQLAARDGVLMVLGLHPSGLPAALPASPGLVIVSDPPTLPAPSPAA